MEDLEKKIEKMPDIKVNLGGCGCLVIPAVATFLCVCIYKIMLHYGMW